MDLIIIGSGPGGYVAAIRAAQLGLKTAIVEKNKTFGGTCLNIGCIPSKALLQSSEHYAFLKQHAQEYGIGAENTTFDLKQMMQRKEKIVDGLVTGVAGLLKKNKVEIIKGVARFISPEEIEVEGNRYRAKNFLLATGSEPTSLPFLPFDEKHIVSSTGALSLSEVPKKMIVVGAGVIGVELASVYARLGSEVTIVEMLDRICPAMDVQVGKALQQSLVKQGLTFHLNAKVKEGKVVDNQVALKVELGGKTEIFTADVVLVAVGRRPYTQGLGLDKAGIEVSKGFIPVDGYFRTVQPHILAIGDLVDGPMLAHKASEEAIAAVEWLAGQKPHINYMCIPNIIYTHPEVAAVGLTEEEGKALGLELFKGICLLRGNPRARCSGTTEGLVKVIGEKSSGKLIGMHIFGPSASEMIGEGVIALDKRMTVAELANASHGHPTLSEAIKEAALNALGRAIHF